MDPKPAAVNLRSAALAGVHILEGWEVSFVAPEGLLHPGARPLLSLLCEYWNPDSYQYKPFAQGEGAREEDSTGGCRLSSPSVLKCGGHLI